MNYVQELNQQVENLTPQVWDDVTVFSIYSHPILNYISSNRDVLSALLLQAQYNPLLLSMSMSNPVLTKIALYHNERFGVSLRLHIWANDHPEDLPHNHRWSFSSIVLHGGYEHTIFHANRVVDETIKTEDLTPIIIKKQLLGAPYSLHHSALHTAVPDKNTVSLVLRGPTVKPKWLHINRTTNKARWLGGSDKKENRQRNEQYLLTPEKYRHYLSLLSQLHICIFDSEAPLEV